MICPLLKTIRFLIYWHIMISINQHYIFLLYVHIGCPVYFPQAMPADQAKIFGRPVYLPITPLSSSSVSTTGDCRPEVSYGSSLHSWRRQGLATILTSSVPSKNYKENGLFKKKNPSYHYIEGRQKYKYTLVSFNIKFWDRSSICV